MAKIRPTTVKIIETPSQLLKAELPSSDQIARHAYELYELRGRTEGADLDDWLQAERDLLQAERLEPLRVSGLTH